MTKELAQFPAETLLDMIYDDVERGEDFNYEATCNLLGRWRKGLELKPLIALLQSDVTRDRVRGCWYVRELGGPVEELKHPVTALADDWLHDGRWTFAYFMINSGSYDETIAMKLARLLVDYHLVVRKEVIKWAVYTTDEAFEDFSRLIESGASDLKHEFSDPVSTELWATSERKRAMRGLKISRRLRGWESVEDIRADTPEEDNFVFDGLHFSRGNIRRHLERRRAEAQGKTP
jgi:hypothetical protein